MVTLTLNATDANGIAGKIYGSYKAPDYATNPSAATKTFEFLPKTTGVWQAQVTLGPAMGTWIFDSVSVKDPAGNEAVLANQRLYPTGSNLDHLNVTAGVTVTFNSQGGSTVPAQFTASGLVVQPANVYPSIVQPFPPMAGVSPVWPSQLGVPWPPVVLPAGGFGL